MDKETNPKNDIKVIQRPGGNTTINLSWGNEVTQKKKQTEFKMEEINKPKEISEDKNDEKIDQNDDEYKKLKDVKTSVKLHAPPGGKSNFSLG